MLRYLVFFPYLAPRTLAIRAELAGKRFQNQTNDEDLQHLQRSYNLGIPQPIFFSTLPGITLCEASTSLVSQNSLRPCPLTSLNGLLVNSIGKQKLDSYSSICFPGSLQVTVAILYILYIAKFVSVTQMFKTVCCLEILIQEVIKHSLIISLG